MLPYSFLTVPNSGFDAPVDLFSSYFHEANVLFNTVNCFIAELSDGVLQARLDSADSGMWVSHNDGKILSSFELSSQSSNSGSALSQTSIANFFEPKSGCLPAPGPPPRGDGSNLRPKKQKKHKKHSVSNQL